MTTAAFGALDLGSGATAAAAATSHSGNSAAAAADRDAGRRMATERLIWTLKQKRAAAGGAAMLASLESTTTRLHEIDVNVPDFTGSTLLELMVQLAVQLDRLDDDDGPEVETFASVVSRFCQLSWSALAICEPISSPSGNGRTGIELAESAYTSMVKRRQGLNPDANLEGAATSLLLGLLKQIERSQRNTHAERATLLRLTEDHELSEHQRELFGTATGLP